MLSFSLLSVLDMDIAVFTPTQMCYLSTIHSFADAPLFSAFIAVYALRNEEIMHMRARCGQNNPNSQTPRFVYHALMPKIFMYETILFLRPYVQQS